MARVGAPPDRDENFVSQLRPHFRSQAAEAAIINGASDDVTESSDDDGVEGGTSDEGVSLDEESEDFPGFETAMTGLAGWITYYADDFKNGRATDIPPTAC